MTHWRKALSLQSGGVGFRYHRVADRYRNNDSRSVTTPVVVPVAVCRSVSRSCNMARSVRTCCLMIAAAALTWLEFGHTYAQSQSGDWEKTVEAAKREGKVVASIPPSPELGGFFDKTQELTEIRVAEERSNDKR